MHQSDLISCHCVDRWSSSHPQLSLGGCRVAGEECHVQAQLLHLLHMGQLSPLPVLPAPALAQVGLFLLATAGDPQGQDRRPDWLRQQVQGGAVQWVKTFISFSHRACPVFSLMQHLTLFTEDPDSEYPTQDVVWEKFEKAFIAAAGLITHAPVLKDYLYRGLLELQRDNVMYLELRSGLSRVSTRLLFTHLWHGN